MKINRLLIATLISSALLSANTMAADGTITFNGSVTASACTTVVGVAPTGGTFSLNNTVTLPSVTVSGLGSTIGAYAGHTPFQISLTGCTQAAGLNNVRALFSTTTTATGDVDIMGNTVAGATGVGIAILDSTLSQIDLNGGTAKDPGALLPTTAGPIMLNYTAAYKTTNTTVTTGLITGIADYTISYF